MCAWTYGSIDTNAESVSRGISDGTSEGISHTYSGDPYAQGTTWWPSSTYTDDFIRFPRSRNLVDLCDFRRKLRRAARYLTVEEFVELRHRCDEIFDEILRGK